MSTSSHKPTYLVPRDATPGATKRLVNEWARFGAANNLELRNFSCTLAKGNLYKWIVRMVNVFPEPLATQLVLYASKFNVNEIVLELVFDPTYPMVPPKMRVIEPRFLPETVPCIGPGGVVFFPLFREGNWTPIQTVDVCIKELSKYLADSCSDKPESFEFLDPLHRCLYSPAEALSQRIGFVDYYRIMIINDMEHSMGGKISLPPSALEHITSATSPDFPLIFELQQTRVSSHDSTIPGQGQADLIGGAIHQSPSHLVEEGEGLSIELKADSLQRTYAGVSTFDMTDNFVMIPSWIAKNAGMQDGDVITVRMVSLKKGNLIKLKPCNPETFLALDQPKEVLESVLTSYVALQSGDYLHFSFEGSDHIFEVVETSPTRAIDIKDTDLKLEIVMPEGFDESFIPLSEQKSEPTRTSTSNNTSVDDLLSIHAIKGAPICSNCKKEIPRASFSTHEAFCRRNNMPCELCGAVIRIADEKSHFEEVHKLVQCSCGAEVEMRFLVEHKQTTCNHRLIPCAYCKLKKKAVDLPAHEEYCGSRTEKCEKCKKFISIKDFPEHTANNCKFPAAVEGFFGKIKSFFSAATEAP